MGKVREMCVLYIFLYIMSMSFHRNITTEQISTFSLMHRYRKFVFFTIVLSLCLLVLWFFFPGKRNIYRRKNSNPFITSYGVAAFFCNGWWTCNTPISFLPFHCMWFCKSMSTIRVICNIGCINYMRDNIIFKCNAISNPFLKGFMVDHCITEVVY